MKQPHQPTVNQLHIPGYRHLQDPDLIQRLDGDGNYTRITLVGQESPLMVAQTLKYFEAQLPHFIRASKSTMIHPAIIKGTIQTDAKTLHLQLSGGRQVLVSRRRIPRILQQLSR